MKIKYNYLAYFVILVFIFGSLAAPNSELNETNMSNNKFGDLDNSIQMNDYSNSSVNYQTTVRTDAPEVTTAVIDWDSVYGNMWWSTYDENNNGVTDQIRIGGEMRAEFSGGSVTATFHLRINSSELGIVYNQNHTETEFLDQYFNMYEIMFQANHSANFKIIMDFYLNGNYTETETRDVQMESATQINENEFSQYFETRISSRALTKCVGDGGSQAGILSHNSECTSYPDAVSFRVEANMYFQGDWDDRPYDTLDLRIEWEIFTERQVQGLSVNETLLEGFSQKLNTANFYMDMYDIVYYGSFYENGTYYFRTSLFINDVKMNEQIISKYLNTLVSSENLDADFEVNDMNDNGLTDAIEYSWEYRRVFKDDVTVKMQLKNSNNLTINQQTTEIKGGFDSWTYDYDIISDLTPDNYTLTLTLLRNGVVEDIITETFSIQEKSAYYDQDFYFWLDYRNFGSWRLSYDIWYVGANSITEGLNFTLNISVLDENSLVLLDNFELDVRDISEWADSDGEKYLYTNFRTSLPKYNTSNLLFNATLSSYNNNGLLEIDSIEQDYNFNDDRIIEGLENINIENDYSWIYAESDEGMIEFTSRIYYWGMDEYSKADLEIITEGDVNQTIYFRTYDLKEIGVIWSESVKFVNFNGSVKFKMLLHLTDALGNTKTGVVYSTDSFTMKANPDNFTLRYFNSDAWSQNDCYYQFMYRFEMRYADLSETNLTIETVFTNTMQDVNNTQNYTKSYTMMIAGSKNYDWNEIPILVDFNGQYSHEVNIYLNGTLISEHNFETRTVCPLTENNYNSEKYGYFDENGYLYSSWNLNGYVEANTHISYELNIWYYNEFSNNYIMIDQNYFDWVVSGSLNNMDWYERPRVSINLDFMYVGLYIYDLTIIVGDTVIDRTVVNMDVLNTNYEEEYLDLYTRIEMEDWANNQPNVLRFEYGICCDLADISSYTGKIIISLFDEELNEFIPVEQETIIIPVHEANRGDYWNNWYYYISETGIYYATLYWIDSNGVIQAQSELQSLMYEYPYIEEQYNDQYIDVWGYVSDYCCERTGARLSYELYGYSTINYNVEFRYEIFERYSFDLVLEDKLEIISPVGELNLWNEIFIPLDIGEYSSIMLVFIDGVLYSSNTNTFEVYDRNEPGRNTNPPILSAFADKYEMDSNEYLQATFNINDTTSGVVDIAINGESIFTEQYYFDTQAVLTLGGLIDGMYNVSITLQNMKDWSAMFWFMLKVGDGGVNTTDPTDPTDPTETSDPTDPTETSSSETNSTETAGNETSQDVPQTGGVTNAPSLPISFLWIVIPLLAIPVLRRK